MCGRIIVIDSVEVIEKRFKLGPQNFTFEPLYNAGIGSYTPVITQEQPEQLQLFQFGLTPSWAKKPSYLFNARSEGDLNSDDNPWYAGEKGIINKPAFKKPIRSQRCLVVASAFLEGPKGVGLSKPYVVYMKDHQRPFALAGIYDTWQNPSTGEVLKSYSIVTTTANDLLKEIGHHRMPVILDPNAESTWLNPQSSLSEITSLLKPFDFNKMNAYPVSPEIKSPKVNNKDLLQPIGQRVYPEQEYIPVQKIYEVGFGHGKRREI